MALAGVGIIPAMEPSRGYTEMVPFNPLLQAERGREGLGVLFGCSFVILYLTEDVEPLGMSFHEFSVVKMNDKNTLRYRRVALAPLSFTVKLISHLGVCFHSIPVTCRGVFLRLIV